MPVVNPAGRKAVPVVPVPSPLSVKVRHWAGRSRTGWPGVVLIGKVSAVAVTADRELDH